jgi:hypothetical protein
MKVWSKVHITDKNKDVEIISKALTNYLYAYGPINDLSKKYKFDRTDKVRLNQYTANRIAGLLLLYLSKDYERINDIVNKYNLDNHQFIDILPEIEGYVEKK